MSRGKLTKTLDRVRTSAALGISVAAGFIAATQASAAIASADGTRGDSAPRNEVIVKEIAGRLFFSERGGAFEELPLGDSAAAASLRSLVRAHAADGTPLEVDVGRTVVADGASGYHGDPKKSPNDNQKDGK